MGLKRNLKKAKRSKKKASKKASKKTSKKTSKKKKGKKLIGGVNGEVVPNEEAGENGVVPTDPAPAPASGGSKKKLYLKLNQVILLMNQKLWRVENVERKLLKK